MAKQRAAIIQLQGTLAGLTFVNSKRYGPHVRTARFSGNKGKVNKAFQEKCAKASPVTATGSPLLKQFKNIERGFADGSLWSRMLARMMKCGETAVPDLLESLNGIELHPDYPFSALYGRAPELEKKKRKPTWPWMYNWSGTRCFLRRCTRRITCLSLRYCLLTARADV